MNLFCGFFAIVKASQENYVMAAWLIVLAGIFDALDGAMARLTNSASEFGVELDSLADVVSFGTAPSFILYQAFFHQWSTPGVVLAALPAICGALRLARFNVQLVGFDKDYFRGLPIPSAALTLISYLVFFHLPVENQLPPTDAKPAVLAIITVLVSLLMVSTIRYDTLPTFSPAGIRKAPVKFIGFLLVIVAVIVTGGKAIFPLMTAYLIYGAIRQLVITMRRQDEEADDTMEEEEATPFDI
jgi:CDP-diacylglycerol--serine O-phosphatidyltransferase